MRETLLARLALFCARHHRAVFAVAGLLVLLAASVFVLKPVRIESDVLDLLPRKNPAVRDFREATEDFKSLDYLFVLLETGDPEKRPIGDYEPVADAFVEGLKQTGLVEGVEYRLQDFEPAIEALLPYTLLYLPPSALPAVEERFTDAAIARQVAANARLLSNPASLVTKELVQLDPFGLLPVLKNHFAGKTRKLKVDLSDGYYVSVDGEALLLIVRPKRPAQDIPFGRKLMAEVRRVEGEVRREFGEDDPEAMEALRIRYGGGYAIAQDDADLIRRDAVVNTAVSAVLVLAVFLLAFRRKSALAYGWVPLILGIFLTFAVVHLLGIRLNSATAGFAALLIGLGIDFATVLYGRYVEERNGGRTMEEALRTTMGKTGTGVLVGAVTTACTFGAMVVTEFEGMRQVGIFTAAGILLTAFTVFTLLPAMLRFHHLHKQKREEEPTFHMHAFWLDAVGRFSARHPVRVLTVALLGTAVMIFLAARIQLDENIKNLRSERNQGLRTTQEIGSRFGASLTYMMVLLEGSTPEEVLEKADRAAEAVQPFIRSGDILFADSPSAYVPPPERQRAVMEAIGARPEAFSFARIRAAFLRASLREGFDPAFFQHYLESLERMLEPRRPFTFEEALRTPLKPLLEKFLIEKAPGRYRGVVYLYVSEEYRRVEPRGLTAAVQAAVPGARLAGVNVFSTALREAIKRDALLAFLVGNLAVILLIALDFRSLRLGLLALAPLMVALVWLLGAMVLLGQPLNLMNIFVTTLILGIGSDYGIYFVHRHEEPDGRDMDRVVQEAGAPIAIAALTTMAGFGSMVTSSYPGLRSIGWVSLLGTVFSMVGTLTVLVAILTLWDRHRARKEAKSPGVEREGTKG